MALGTIIGALAGGAASAAAGAGISSLFGGGDAGSINAPAKAKPIDIKAGGLISKTSGKKVKITSTGQRKKLVGQISSTFGSQADELGSLRELVETGFGRLTSSRLREIENARRRSIGNLRDNLARRRVLGSSFAGDALTRGELEFAQEKEKAAAESFLQELDLSVQLLNQESEANRQQFQVNLDEMNLQADLALKLATNATSALTNSAQLQTILATNQAKLDASAISGEGQLAGQVLGPAIKTLSSSVGTGVAGLFS